MTLIATVGFSGSNSYVSVADANDYMSNRYSSGSWAAATDVQKEQTLITATQRLEAEDYVGIRSSVDQALKWPRYGVLKPDAYTWYQPDEMPTDIKRATAELALALLTELTSMDEELEPLKYSELDIGPISLVHRGPMSGFRLPDIVRRYLYPYLTTPSRASVQTWR